jgi:hypothetical protein
MLKPVLALVGTLLLAGSGAAAEIQGEYIEARTADVFTGPCFSNAEVLIYGKQAVMAWRVTQGTRDGVDLRGLTVAAAVEGTSTFSLDQPDKAQTVLIVEESATPRQRDALVSLAKELAGNRLANIAAIKTARIQFKVEPHSAADAETPTAHAMPHAPRASFWAAGLARIVTRPLDERDHACGNEVVAYPPLSKNVDALPAYTLGHQFKGEGLETRWDDPNCRSSFVGRFTL